MKVTGEQIAQKNKPATRFERKFFIVPRKLGLAYMLLRQFCRRHPDYPEEQIHY